MPIVTRIKLAELCQDRPDATKVYIHRGKMVLVPGEKDLVDTDNPQNAAFIAERQLFNQAKSLGELPIKSAKIAAEKAVIEGKRGRGRPKKGEESPKNEPKSTQSPAEIRQRERILADAAELSRAKMDQEMLAKQQEMELRALKIQSEKIRLDKTAGNLLPIDLAAGVIERHANTILKTFEKGFERIGELYANMAGFDPKAKADFMKECRDELSLCVSKAGEQASDEIDILVDNYSETLMVGQRKA